MSASCVNRLAMLGVGVMLMSCSNLNQRAEAVRITAADADVAGCTRIGPVLLGSYDTEFSARQLALKAETVRRGGNVLLVTSYALATGGTAFNCASGNSVS